MSASFALLVAGLLAFHPAVPNTVGNLGSLLESFLPWLGLAVPGLLVVGLLRRSPLTLAASLVPAVTWAWLFGPLVLATDYGTTEDPATPNAAAHRPAGPNSSGPNSVGQGTTALELTALQHNVSDDNPDPAGTARALAQAGADLIAVEEISLKTLPIYEAAFASRYPYHAVAGTVGLWSTFPLTDSRPVDIKPEDLRANWNRGLRSTLRTPQGDIAVYVAHLPSVRVRLPGGFSSNRRDRSAATLGATIGAERLDRVVLLGDLNSTLDDRGLRPVTSRMTAAVRGFDFSWPAVFPIARIDHILTRGAIATDVWKLPATGSDHLPIAARLKLTTTGEAPATPV